MAEPSEADPIVSEPSVPAPDATVTNEPDSTVQGNTEVDVGNLQGMFPDGRTEYPAEAPAEGGMEYSEMVREVIMVPKRKWGAVIGRGGTNIRRMQEETGVMMRLRTDSTAEEAPMELTGDPVSVSYASTMIYEFITDCRGRFQDPLETVRGTGTPRESNYFPPSFMTHEAPTTDPASSGQPTALDAATPTEAALCYQEVRVPGESVGRIIGKGGDMIHSIMEQSGAFVQFDQNEDKFAEERTLIMKGTEAALLHAQGLVWKIVEKVHLMGQTASSSTPRTRQ